MTVKQGTPRLNLIYHNTYCHQPFQSGDLMREAPTLKVLISWFCDFDFLLCDLQL